MIEIGHLAPSMANPNQHLTNIAENIQPYIQVSLTKENVVMTAVQSYMIETASLVYYQRSCHTFAIEDEFWIARLSPLFIAPPSLHRKDQE